MTQTEWVRPLAEVLLSQLFACREYKDGRAAEACCQSGLVVVNAVSDWFRVRNFRDGACWSQSYERGQSLGPFRREPTTAELGVELRYRPDRCLLGPLGSEGRAVARWFRGLGRGSVWVAIEAIEAASGSAIVVFEGITPRPADA